MAISTTDCAAEPPRSSPLKPMALFATLPYGKFAHGVFRSAALLRYAVEKRQPNPIGLGAD